MTDCVVRDFDQHAERLTEIVLLELPRRGESILLLYVVQYSPYLALCDFHYFSKPKGHGRGHHFLLDDDAPSP
jgi:hypothetical protein